MRLMGALVAGVVVSLALFLLMQALISGSAENAAVASQAARLDFVRIQPDEMTRMRERRKPLKPPPPRRLPPPPRISSTQQEKPAPRALDLELPEIPVSPSTASGPYLGALSLSGISAEGDIIPIVRIEPQYPRDALLNSIEGWVKVEFTINEDGTVSDPRVLEAEPRRIFDRSAMRAILRWKFKPRVVDGQAVKRRATQIIEYKLDPSDA